MDHVHSTTTEHQKGKHLSYDERFLIQIRLKDGWSANKIAKEIGCAPNTVRNEIRRGTVALYRGNVQRYKAKVGQKSGNDQVLLTLAERKSREYWMLPIKNREADSVMEAFQVLQETYSEHFGEVFKTITTDNGSEFSKLSELEELAETLVYYTHPYTSCEKGTNERHNGIIRRFIPKGKRISDFDADYISGIEMWCNSLPRKILNYRTPDEVFEDELDRIYRRSAS